MIDFRIGDIVKLINSKISEEGFYSPWGLCTIKEINEDSCIINGIKQPIKLNEIRPVSIDGSDAQEVYLDYPSKAYVIGDTSTYSGENRHRYFMDVLKEKYPNTHQIIRRFNYIHEVQHYLAEQKDLKLSLRLFIAYNE